MNISSIFFFFYYKIAFNRLQTSRRIISMEITRVVANGTDARTPFPFGYVDEGGGGRR